MASCKADDDDPEFVILRCADFNSYSDDDQKEIFISTAEMNSWNLTSILAHPIINIKADRNRMTEHSSYFRGLLSGSFNESGLSKLSVQWSKEWFLSVLRFMFGCAVDVTSDNFFLLYEAALFFGVDMLLLKCQIWLREVTSFNGLWPPQFSLDSLIHIWKYGSEHAYDLIPELCSSCLARNFMLAISCDSFVDVPYQLLYSGMHHPDLTVDSEKHLCDAVLTWTAANITHSGYLSTTEDCYSDILKQIRTNLLPLWFAAGKRRCCLFSKFADESIGNILRLAGHPLTDLISICGDEDFSALRIRLTEYTKKVDLSGCPQIRPILLLSLLPLSYCRDIEWRKNVKLPFVNFQHESWDRYLTPWHLLPTLTFGAVEEVDISNCPNLDLEDGVQCFSKSFPSLVKLRAAHFICYDTKRFQHLVEKCPLLCEIDLTVDISPVIPSKVSVISSSPAYASVRLTRVSNIGTGWQLSNITRITLEGRTDVYDSGLQNIAQFCPSLSYLNLNGCISVTDAGISILITKCIKLHSIMACDTSFGDNSVRALCYSLPNPDGLGVLQIEQCLQSFAWKLQVLHIGCCKGVSETSLLELISRTYMLEHLCVQETQLGEGALYNFQGSSLEKLDVSETKVSASSLTHVVRQNPRLKSLIARGCRLLSQDKSHNEGRDYSKLLYTSNQLYSELGKSCKLEEIAVGWGFSSFSLEVLKPAVISLKKIVVGLGGSLGQDGLQLLPDWCPLLDTLMIYFQVISDFLIINIMQNLRHLQFLALCYCFGEISSVSFKFSMPSLRKLKLERVTPWLTNADLVILTQNCANLVELSLLGCRLLNSESQDVISRGWPGLICIHLEDCGEVTSNGVLSLMNCLALEDLLLRHCGSGIPRNFIAHAASKMPMLRKLSLDVCDAKDGDLNIPKFSDRCFFSSVKIARCKLKRSTLDVHKLDVRRTPVHKETLVLVWDSKKLTRTTVKERL